MRVHLKGEYSTKELKSLQDLLSERISLTSGDIDFQNDCSVLVAGRVTEKEVAFCRELKAVVIPWAGVPPVTLDTLRNHPEISLHNIHHNAVAAAELAITLMLAAAKLIIPADQSLRKGDWSPRYRPEGKIIEDCRVLVLGWGSIGRRIGGVCNAMGAAVKGIRRTPDPELFAPGELPVLLKETDILFITLPLTHETRGLIGEKELNLLPEKAILVNVSRGSVVEEEALFKHLKTGRLGAAGLDVWYNYPDTEESRTSTMPSSFNFGSLSNVVMSPHRGGAFGLQELERRRLGHLAALLLALEEGKNEKGKIDLNTGY